MSRPRQIQEPLSHRETEVAQAYASGLSYKHIAREFGIAPATVRTHLETIYRKLDVSTKIQLAQRVSSPTAALPEAANPLPSPLNAQPLSDLTAFARIEPKRFTVAIAGIENDHENELQDIVAHDLAEFQGLNVVCLNEIVSMSGPVPEKAIADSERRARALLEVTGASLLVWGKVFRFAGTAVPQLRLSTQRIKSQRPGRYPPNQELRLPRVFWADISKVLRMVVAALNGEFLELEGHYLAERLEPFVARVHLLLDNANDATGWSKEALGLTRAILGDCETLLGSQNGQRIWLERAVSSFETALAELQAAGKAGELTRAMSGLGIALWMLGDRDADHDMIQRGVSILREVVGTLDPLADPLAWGHAHIHFGNALSAAAKLHGGADHYQRALEAYRAALSRLSVEEHPLDWAQTKNNIAVSLWRAGRCSEDLDLLRRAMLELTDTLQVYDPTTAPLDWSQSENNLGLVCWDVARIGAEVPRYEEAIGHYDRALRERDRARVPLLWAQTQNNVGLAYLSMGDETGSMEALQRAVAAFTLSLEERTREQARGEWLESCNNLGTALWRLSERLNSSEKLEQAIEIFRTALDAIDESERPAIAVDLQRNLGNALASLGGRNGERAFYDEALEHLGAARIAVSDQETPILAAEILGDIGLMAKRVAEAFRDPTQLDYARHAFEEASLAYRAADLPRHEAACRKQAEAIAEQPARRGSKT